ncbi:type VI secretion system protein VasG [Bryocella elongata]|uniref:Type VI secretion system protein VasG n=1 Tax=Bryocella elongata TaxID=863522 RepID=A0A1H6ADQ5_9BACT|nr:type VI secretion system ATPase TssH [Bryocella elongata]SEG46410.1 type VI secretion system protein VasG [Bryocella elongata]
MSLNLKSLISKLNDTTRSALEAAAGLCVSRAHYDIEIEHYLLKTLESSDNDIAAILRHYGIDKSRLTADLQRSLDKLKSGNARSPAFSPLLVKTLSEAWTLASIEFDAGSIRTGLTLLALLSNEELARVLRETTTELRKVEAEGLRVAFYDIVSNSAERQSPLGASVASGGPVSTSGPSGAASPSGGKTPHLDQYTVNLTANAKAGKIDPVLGRDAEVRQMIDILMRRRQNNPILTGEAGVGKTAVVEGFANRVAEGDVPPALQGVQLHSLDLALLQAGASVKGEFENRLKGLINEVKSSTAKIILFIDEAHTMIGAGGQAGQNDAANLLKPALARGELRTIAATTWSEYKKYFEKDPALARRFQVVKVEEPTEEVCCTMLRGIVSSLEKHHNLRILDEAITSTVKLSHRYLAGRQLPDKAVSVLDTACARLSLGQNSQPPTLEEVSRRIDSLHVQRRILERETAIGANHDERIAAIDKDIAICDEEKKILEGQWEKEKGIVSEIRSIQATLEDAVSKKEAAPEGAKERLSALEKELIDLQGETGMMRVAVDAQIVGEVISAWTGIPLGKMMKDEIETVLSLDVHLKKKVIGQDHALEAISQRIITSRANMDDPVKPVGVFMLVGPSGVGKTETAIALSDLLFGGERNMITINMSEFQEAHTVSTLKGSPPGYVGYGEGGVLTEAVRRRPYSVVLLDEVEKAHPDVLELFFQVFDKGRMEDGEGREIDFRNTVIILTSNAATDTLMKLTADPETMPNGDGLLLAMKPELNAIFKPAFLGRMLVVPYFPVRDENLKKIIRLKLGKIQRRLLETHHIEMGYDDALLNGVADRCTEVESGARNVDNILSNTLLPEMSRQILGRLASGTSAASVNVTIDDGKFAYVWG